MQAGTKAKGATCALVMIIWWLLSLIYPPLVIPTISSVWVKLIEILTSGEMLQTIALTMGRLLTALAIGILAGFLTGMLCSYSKHLRSMTEPLIGLLQVIPPVSLLILAIIWFGFNGKPAVFIVVMAIFPTMVISVQTGILNIDGKLLEMGRIFGLSRRSMFFDIIIPSISPSLRSGWRISLGLACKTMVMGEVLTTPTGIGGALATARMDLEPETVIAWTVITVLLFILIDRVTGIKTLPFGTARPAIVESEDSERPPGEEEKREARHA